MLKWLRIKLATMFGGKKDDFKRDAQGHALANRYDVDDYPNEPDDSPTPDIRMPDDPNERDKTWELLKDAGNKGLSTDGPP